MFCSKCGEMNPDNAKFCGRCGSMIEKQVEPTYANPTYENPSYTNPTYENPTYANPTYQTPIYDNPSSNGTTYQSSTYIDRPKAPKSTKKLVAILSSIAVVVTALVLLFVFVLRSSKDPVSAIKDALFNTADSESMTVNIKGNNNLGLEETIKLDLRDETIYASLAYTIDGLSRQEFYVLDEDGFYVITQSSGDDSEEKEYSVQRAMSKREAEEFRDVLNSAKKGESEIIKSLEEVLDDEIGSHVDCDDLESLLDSVIDEFDKSENLEDCLGCEVSKEDGETVYTFKPDLYKCLRLLLEQVEDRFEDKDDYDEIMDEIKDEKSSFGDMDLEVKIGIKGNLLSSFNIKYDDEDSESFEGTISDVNSTKVELPKDAQKALEDYKEDN